VPTGRRRSYLPALEGRLHKARSRSAIASPQHSSNIDVQTERFSNLEFRFQFLCFKVYRKVRTAIDVTASGAV
jgi:hypothetical protein